MRLILLGPPGSGKGTQAKLLCSRNHLVHIATGDILRRAIEENTPAGARARPFMEAGKLVPDELVNGVIAERFASADRPTRFVMDGYPRSLVQADTFDALLDRHHLCLAAVVLLTVDDEEIVRRVAGRWVCPRCQTPYHVESNPPRVPGVCDLDGVRLEQRPDDRAETVRARLEVYRNNTAGLARHYRDKGLLREVFASGDIEGVYQRILEVLRGQAGSSC